MALCWCSAPESQPADLYTNTEWEDNLMKTSLKHSDLLSVSLVLSGKVYFQASKFSVQSLWERHTDYSREWSHSGANKGTGHIQIHGDCWGSELFSLKGQNNWGRLKESSITLQNKRAKRTAEGTTSLTSVSGGVVEQKIPEVMSRHMKNKMVRGNSQHRYIKGKKCVWLS